MLEIEVTANGFLRYMVRAIAGALLAVSRGELSTEDLREAIDSGQRPMEVVTAPANGLTLLNVRYE
jgi:tRNA pseudouridine38-40 synthase